VVLVGAAFNDTLYSDRFTAAKMKANLQSKLSQNTQPESSHKIPTSTRKSKLNEIKALFGCVLQNPVSNRSITPMLQLSRPSQPMMYLQIKIKTVTKIVKLKKLQRHRMIETYTRNRNLI